jgi:hypothetical protein
MPTTTNGLTYPAATATPNGPSAIQQLATDIETKLLSAPSSPTSFTPTLTNVSGGTLSAKHVKVGKEGRVYLEFSAGTVTATGVVTITLPSGWTADTNIGSALSAIRSTAPVSARVAGASTTILLVDGSGNSLTAGTSLVSLRITGSVLLA